MLINATQEEELRVAIVDGQKLYDLDIEVDSSQQKKANIYKGRITRIEPSLDAAFVDYGAERHGFLPLKDISREYFVKQPEQGGRINIKEVLKEGQDIVVQIDKDERGNKGAALTTFISLAGRFIVLMPNNPRGGGVSRRISGEDREEIRRVQRELDIPEGMSCIVRTAGIGRSIEELSWDLEYLKGVWQSIMQVVLDKPSPFLIYQDSSPVVRALRDHFNAEVGEIIIDDDGTFKVAQEFMEHAMPHNLRKLKPYHDEVPLFTRFQIESQIESAYAHTVNLPSGGSIVIDHTEALISIDINSARATKGGDIEATALTTNLEAAEEVARQCRIRDLGGLLVIDFIDMGPNRNQREVENRLRECVRTDRARVQIGRISRFGLLEMSRQRMRRSLGESAHQICPRCNGSGNVRSVESLALAILRLVGEESRKERTAKIIAELPINVATFLLNEKREEIFSIESRSSAQILLVSNPALETPNYTIRRVRDDQTLLAENSGASYTLTTPEDNLLEEALNSAAKKPAEKPAVSGVKPSTPAPAPTPAPASDAATTEPGEQSGLFGFFKKLLGSEGEEQQPAEQPAKRRKPASGKPKPDGEKSGGQEQRSRRSRNRRRGKSSGKPTGDSGRQQSTRQGRPQQAKTTKGPQEGQQKDGESAAPSGRRRRRRRKPANRDKAGEGSRQAQGGDKENSAEGKNKQQNAGNRDKGSKPKAQPRRSGQGESQQPAQDAAKKKGDDKPVDNATKTTSPATAAAAPEKARKPAADKPKQPAKSDTASNSSDKERVLPWESTGESQKTYKVWSSDED